MVLAVVTRGTALGAVLALRLADGVLVEQRRVERGRKSDHVPTQVNQVVAGRACALVRVRVVRVEQPVTAVLGVDCSAQTLAQPLLEEREALRRSEVRLKLHGRTELRRIALEQRRARVGRGRVLVFGRSASRGRLAHHDERRVDVVRTQPQPHELLAVVAVVSVDEHVARRGLRAPARRAAVLELGRRRHEHQPDGRLVRHAFGCAIFGRAGQRERAERGAERANHLAHGLEGVGAGGADVEGHPRLVLAGAEAVDVIVLDPEPVGVPVMVRITVGGGRRTQCAAHRERRGGGLERAVVDEISEEKEECERRDAQSGRSQRAYTPRQCGYRCGAERVHGVGGDALVTWLAA
mmetsp:Transcript_11950/g.31225  ORF Transcript_11950/g.31225 Transcript_11950/m.31225 type:complete len:352 (-) Transcript_11950:44-1099(-)